MAMHCLKQYLLLRLSATTSFLDQSVIGNEWSCVLSVSLSDDGPGFLEGLGTDRDTLCLAHLDVVTGSKLHPIYNSKDHSD